jgi:hypothetical protein
MDARQQRTVAPLDRTIRLTTFERAAKNHPVRLQRQQASVRIFSRHAEVASEPFGGGRAAAGEAATQQFDNRLLSPKGSSRARPGWFDHRMQHDLPVNRAELGDALGGHP